MRIVRNSTKAIIIQDERILLIQLKDQEGAWYALPGGGQRVGETLSQALQRECQEEVGLQVQVGTLQYIREYISWHHEDANSEGDVHQVEFFFNCTVDKSAEPSLGPVPDTRQTSVVWVPLQELVTLRVYPKALASLLSSSAPAAGPRYLGDIN